jgi:hypothetical protein
VPEWFAYNEREVAKRPVVKRFVLTIVLLAINSSCVAQDENTIVSVLDNCGNDWRSVAIDLDNSEDAYKTAWYAGHGMFIGALTGFGTTLAITVPLRGVLPIAASLFLGVSGTVVQMGIGAYIGYRCKQQKICG